MAWLLQRYFQKMNFAECFTFFVNFDEVARGYSEETMINEDGIASRCSVSSGEDTVHFFDLCQSSCKVYLFLL